MENEYVATYEELVGTMLQRSAAEELIYVQYQGAIRASMLKQGYDYAAPPFRDPFRNLAHMSTPIEASALLPLSAVPSSAVGLGIADELSDLHEFDVLGTPNPGFESLTSAAERRAYSQSARDCQPAQDTYTSIGEFPQNDGLLSAFSEMAAKAERAPDTTAGMEDYAACMMEGGFDMSSVAALRTLVQSRFLDPAEPANQPGTPGWAKAVDLERSAAERDAHCRGAAHVAALAALDPLLREFALAHDSELAASVERWERVRIEADSVQGALADLDPLRP